MSSDYPLTPFTDFATKLDFELEEPKGMNGWGLMKPERRPEAVPPSGNYEGMGDRDVPYPQQLGFAWDGRSWVKADGSS